MKVEIDVGVLTELKFVFNVIADILLVVGDNFDVNCEELLLIIEDAVTKVKGADGNFTVDFVFDCNVVFFCIITAVSHIASIENSVLLGVSGTEDEVGDSVLISENSFSVYETELCLLLEWTVSGVVLADLVLVSEGKFVVNCTELLLLSVDAVAEVKKL